jgi:hypothetical protein
LEERKFATEIGQIGTFKSRLQHFVFLKVNFEVFQNSSKIVFDLVLAIALFSGFAPLSSQVLTT